MHCTTVCRTGVGDAGGTKRNAFWLSKEQHWQGIKSTKKEEEQTLIYFVLK